jgi:hypothetical protein
MKKKRLVPHETTSTRGSRMKKSAMQRWGDSSHFCLLPPDPCSTAAALPNYRGCDANCGVGEGTTCMIQLPPPSLGHLFFNKPLGKFY